MIQEKPKILVLPRKPPRLAPCPTCGGEGSRMPPFRDILAYDKDPQDLVEWCPQCGGEGRVLEEWKAWELENEDPYETLFARSPEREAELAEWVRAYREARCQAHLPPEEASRVASDAVYGPLPF